MVVELWKNFWLFEIDFRLVFSDLKGEKIEDLSSSSAEMASHGGSSRKSLTLSMSSQGKKKASENGTVPDSARKSVATTRSM